MRWEGELRKEVVCLQVRAAGEGGRDSYVNEAGGAERRGAWGVHPGVAAGGTYEQRGYWITSMREREELET